MAERSLSNSTRREGIRLSEVSYSFKIFKNGKQVTTTIVKNVYLVILGSENFYNFQNLFFLFFFGIEKQR